MKPDDIEDLMQDAPDTANKKLLRGLFGKRASGEIFSEKTSSKYPGFEIWNLSVSQCYSCKQISLWQYTRLIVPPSQRGPKPNPDLSDDVRKDYEEASSILDLSPRGAAALLRLCIEKLCLELKAGGKSLDDMIADLVSKGLDVRVQQALDAVRVIGNHAVHSGKIDLRDDGDTATMLLDLVNLIAEKMISEPAHVEAFYKTLPPEKLKAIENRDKSST